MLVIFSMTKAGLPPTIEAAFLEAGEYHMDGTYDAIRIGLCPTGTPLLLLPLLGLMCKHLLELGMNTLHLVGINFHNPP